MLRKTRIFNCIPSTDKQDDWLASRLAVHGPVLTCLDCDDSWNYIKKDGLLNKYLKKTIDGGHAVSIVGYTPTHFIIRNSWGTGWGDKGFAYASYEYAEAAFKEADGVIV